ncbi:MAG: MASE3 domain-containing protein, partial [Candidatus Desulfatibia sp.]|uniref:MASE3 domain-containing protein n=1 Tax=Candidatus Desulfatibia sp. TaxID=3101189 RepID=UPI002F31F256
MNKVNLGLMEDNLSEQEAKRDIETENIKDLLKFVPFAAVAVAILILVGVSNFRLFHILSELFAVFIAFFTFSTALLTFKVSRNNFIMYLGCGYFWVGMLDLAHALFFENVGIISGNSTNVSAQLWISARYLEAFLLLTSFYFLKRKVNIWLVFSGFGLFSIILYSLIAAGIFPDCFVEGRGLTAFKKGSEYVIIGILFLTLLRRKYVKHLLEENVYNKIFLAIDITIISETLFTLYSNASSGYVIAGHITKIFS